MELIKQQGYKVNNIDSTIICELPKMQPHILAMRENLTKIMKLVINQVSVKATTTEKLGFCGRGEGIAVQSVYLLSC